MCVFSTWKNWTFSFIEIFKCCVFIDYLLILSLPEEQTWVSEGDAAHQFLKLETWQSFIKSYNPDLWELVLSHIFCKAHLLIAHGVPSL